MSAPVGIGDTVAGKYVVERHLAKGGMGVVVVARHLQLSRQVAIKFMLPHLLDAGVEPGALERFVREGRAAVKLRGENVARVLDVDTLPGGMPFMVMEYLEGEDLGQHIQRHGPLPLAESVDIVLQACVAMAEAHLCGIIHRDLKPSNLFITRRPDGSALVKVLDFGISKLYEDTGGESTQTAAIMGSPSYMAPEQAQSARDADARSDIWSLGVILYQCTSRQLPYAKASSTAAVVAQLIYEQPRPLAEAAPSLPAAFCEVVDRCLTKEPAGRYQSIGELASALVPFASAVGRQAAASIHAIIGGVAAAPGAPRTDAEPAPAPVARPAAAPAPVLARSTAAPEPGPGVAGLDADALAEVQPLEMAPTGSEPEPEPEPEPPGRLVARIPGLAPTPLPGRAVAGAPTPAPAPPTGWRAWAGKPGVAVGVAAVLGVLTALALLGGDEPLFPVSLVDRVNALIHNLGYQATVRYVPYERALAGPIAQVAVPLVLAIVLTAVRRWLGAVVAWWWLGASVVMVSRAMTPAPWEQISPITGGVEPWGHWLAVWGLHADAESVSLAVFWAGGVLMIVPTLVALWRVVGKRRRSSSPLPPLDGP